MALIPILRNSYLDGLVIDGRPLPPDLTPEEILLCKRYAKEIAAFAKDGINIGFEWPSFEDKRNRLRKELAEVHLPTLPGEERMLIDLRNYYLEGLVLENQPLPPGLTPKEELFCKKVAKERDECWVLTGVMRVFDRNAYEFYREELLKEIEQCQP
jgi:hypothetical protein